jgi:hypothetical protein
MKTLLLFIVLLLPALTYSQTIEKFDLTKDGVKPVVIQFDSLNASQLYSKAINWVQETYKNPEVVLKTKIENEKLRVDGIATNVWFYKSMGMTIFYDVEYSFHIEIKDKKVRLSFTFGNTISGGKSYFLDYTKLWKENGEVYKMYKETKPGMDKMMNDLAISFCTYIKGKKQSEW